MRLGGRLAVGAVAATLAWIAPESGTGQELQFFLPPAQIRVPVHNSVTLISPRDRAARGPESSIQFEADIFFSLPLLRQIGWNQVRTGTDSGFNVYFTPRTILRGLTDFSSPLRSPSFMPRFDLQYLWTKWQPPAAGRVDGVRELLGLTLSHGHHSNGGPDCLLIEEGPFPDPQEPAGLSCQLPSGTDLSQTTVNPSGSFSTNFFSLKASAGWIRMDDPGPEVSWLGTISLFGEINPQGWGFLYVVGGKTSSVQRVIMGAYRWGGRVEYEFPRWGPGRFGGNLEIAHITNRGRDDNLEDNLGMYWDELSEVTVLAEVFYKLDDWVSGWGIVARYYGGQDYYNLEFVKDVRRFDLGIYIDRSRRR